MATDKRTNNQGHGRPQAVAPEEEGLGVVVAADDLIRLAFRYLKHLIDNHRGLVRTMDLGTTQKAVLATLDKVDDIIDAAQLMLTGITNEEK